jgi:hypothetical protein
MEIKYANNSSQKKIGRQLWATFKWGGYTGCIRFCPGHEYCTNHVQFEENCILKPGVWAGATPRGIEVWNFRWRGECEEEGVIAGSDEFETQIEFGEDGDGGLTIAGRIVFGGYKARKFKGVKTGELQGKGNEKGVDSWWKSLRDEYAESKFELCRWTMSDSEDDGSSDESQIGWEKIREDREEEERKKKEEEKQPWPTEMTGEWKIIPRQKFTMNDEDPAAPRWMKIQYEAEAGRRQYYAEFQFGNDWSGIMRFCPEHIDLVKKDKIEVEEFEEACILKDGVTAGPPPKGVDSWLIKWRGILDESGISKTVRRERGPTDEMTTSLTFKRGEEGKLVLDGVLVRGCIVDPFTGVRISDTPPRGHNDLSIEELWDQKKYVPPPPPPPPVPKLWPWISPLPKPTIEAPPAWAWDVLGKWKIDAPEVADALNIGADVPLTMTIHMSNHAQQKKIGRQLWATFQFGPSLSGCMRFCPLPENSRTADTCAIFEKQCVLKKGIWPGHVNPAKGKSFQKWGHRWRARNSETGEDHRCSDTVEHMFEFKREDDGTLKLSGVFGAIWQMCLWSAVKIEDAGQASVSDADVEKVWKSYSSR